MGQTFDNIDPYLETVIGATPDANIADVDAAVAAARTAFDETKWAEDHQFRSRCITQLWRPCSATSRSCGSCWWPRSAPPCS